MVTQLHESLLEMFRQRPALAAQLLSEGLGTDVPDFTSARLDSGDLNDVTPTEYRADAIVVLCEREAPALAVVVEVQLSRDKGKRWSWPVYLTTLRARLRCPTVLLVLCPRNRVGAWCASPIGTGHPGFVLAPLVLGPQQVPHVTDVDEAARSPELAVLSAMAHAAEDDQGKIFKALFSALDVLDDDHASLYHDLVLEALPDAARRHLEELMSAPAFRYEYKSDFVSRYINKGRTEGRADLLLAVLAARDIDVPDDLRTRITDCTDPEQLTTWGTRAATATSIDDLFD